MDEIIPALSNIASSLRDGISCKTLKPEYLSGTAHFIYFIHFNDGVDWVARIPGKSSSLERALPKEDIDRFASEVSTLRWLKDNTSVKVPKLYAWNLPNNPNQTTSDGLSEPQGRNVDTVPWMLMEKVAGVPLSYDMWDGFKDGQREKILAQVADLYIELSCHTFPGIGSLRSQPDTPSSPGIEPLIYRHAFPPAPVLPTDVLSLTSTYRSTLSFISVSSVRDMISHLHQTLSNTLTPSKEFLLGHPDLNPSNIILDPQTLEINGFLDWECAHTVSPLEFCVHPWFIQDRWYVDWEVEGLTRNQRDREWFTEYIRMKISKREDRLKEGFELTSDFEESLGVYLLGQFLHDTVCTNSESLAAVQMKLQPALDEYMRGLRSDQVGAKVEE